MPQYTHNRRDQHLSMPSNKTPGAHDRHSPSPITPAVTGIIYPSEDASTEADSSRYHSPPNNFYTHPNVAASSIDYASEPVQDMEALDHLWDTLRQQKERKMAKERPKVQSLEEAARELSIEQFDIEIPLMEPNGQGSLPKSLKKQKSICSMRESTDGRSIVTTFDLLDVTKRDVHVTYQRNRLIITWATVEVSEWEEDGCIMRDRLQRAFHRTLPLAEGTKFEEVQCVMNGHRLTLRYPNMRCLRVEHRSSRSGKS